MAFHGLFAARTKTIASVCLGLLMLGQLSANSQEMPTEEQAAVASTPAALVRVHLPLRGNADQAVQVTLQRTCDRLLAEVRANKDARRPLLVLQLEPPLGELQANESSQFERVFALAHFLCSREMNGVRTVAFLPRSIQGHGALLAMACEEIVMAPDALLGNAGINEMAEGAVRQSVVAAYREIAEIRRTIPVAIAIGMIDPASEVSQVEAEDGIHFVLRADFESFSQGREIVEQKVLIPRGTMADFDGREGRQLGFVKYLTSTREGVAKAFDISAQALTENNSLAARWQPVIIDLQGKITPRLASQIEALLGRTVEQQNVNWIGLRIDSAGGDLQASLRLANAVANIDPNSVRTVAYVPAEARGGAALVALACDQLVMHSTAKLDAVAPAVPQQPAELEAAKTALQESLAPQTEHRWSLLAAMIDPNIELFQYHNKTTGELRIMSGEEATELTDTEAWLQDEGNLQLPVHGLRAQELGIAWKAVETFDELKRSYGLESDPPIAKPNWALELIEALASPGFSVLLLMVGLTGIYLELRAPGLGVGAFVGTLGLLLFFWSQYLNGTAGWLEVILFVCGLAFILMEIFVVPGFGIFGLGGGALVIASIVLASLTFVRPHSEADMDELARSVATVALACVGFMAFTVASRRYLPQTPLFRRMILTPPAAEERIALDHHEAVADYSELVGASGVATTDLRPAGKAEINHEFIDVIAEGEPLDRGTPLVVVEAKANRVLVRATGPA